MGETTETAVQKLTRRAHEMRQAGNLNLAQLFETQAAMGEKHAQEYLEMISMAGNAAKRIRQREGW